MSAQCEVTAKAAAGAPMNLFERYLTVWVVLCIVAGVVLGQLLPGGVPGHRPDGDRPGQHPGGRADLGDDHPDADEDRLRRAASGQGSTGRGIGVTLFVNWAVKPFSMALLGWLFIRHLFAP